MPSASLCKDTVHHDEKGMAMRAAAALVEARELVSQAVSAVWELIDVNPGSFLSFSSFSVKGMVSSSSGMDLLSSGKPLQKYSHRHTQRPIPLGTLNKPSHLIMKMSCQGQPDQINAVFIDPSCSKGQDSSRQFSIGYFSFSALHIYFVRTLKKCFILQSDHSIQQEKKSKKRTLYLTLITCESQIWAGCFCKDAMVVDLCL